MYIIDYDKLFDEFFPIEQPKTRTTYVPTKFTVDIKEDTPAMPGGIGGGMPGMM